MRYTEQRLRGPTKYQLVSRMVDAEHGPGGNPERRLFVETLKLSTFDRAPWWAIQLRRTGGVW